jgi:hypothetical protein
MMAAKEIRTVGVIVKPNHAEAWKTACELYDWLKQRGIALVGEPRIQQESVDTDKCDIVTVDDAKFAEESDLISGATDEISPPGSSVTRRTGPGIGFGSLGY